MNEVTIKKKYLLPHIDFLFYQLVGPRVFLKIYLRSGYHQIKKSKNSISQRLSSLLDIDYEYLVMFFGLTNAPSYFMYLMNSMFMPELNKFIVVFINDFLVYLKSEDEHVEYLLLVLQRLRDHKLYAKV